MFDCDLRVNVKTMDGQLFESVRVIPGVDGWIWLSAKKDASGSSMIRDATLVQLSSVSTISFQERA